MLDISLVDQAQVISRLKRLEEVQNQYIFEREDVARAITICLIVRGHLLLTGPPGVAKTTQIRLAAATSGEASSFIHSFRRSPPSRRSLAPSTCTPTRKGSAGG